eukprot:c29803_g1_i1 orf=335-598(-)
MFHRSFDIAQKREVVAAGNALKHHILGAKHRNTRKCVFETPKCFGARNDQGKRFIGISLAPEMFPKNFPYVELLGLLLDEMTLSSRC